MTKIQFCSTPIFNEKTQGKCNVSVFQQPNLQKCSRKQVQNHKNHNSALSHQSENADSSRKHVQTGHRRSSLCQTMQNPLDIPRKPNPSSRQPPSSQPASPAIASQPASSQKRRENTCNTTNKARNTRENEYFHTPIEHVHSKCLQVMLIKTIKNIKKNSIKRKSAHKRAS